MQKNVKKIVAVLTVVALGLAFDGPAKAGSGNAKRWTEVVPAGQSLEYQIQYFGGSLAEFGIIGDGGTDVDIYVYDLFGLVVRDIAFSDIGLCSWFPPTTRTYRIVVHNRGSTANTVMMGHN